VNPDQLSAGRSNATFIAWIGLLFLILPVTVVVPVSFTANRYLSLPTEGWSLRHYQAILLEPAWRNSVLDSILVASSSTVLALVLGTLCAIGCWRISSRLSEAIRFLMLAPIIVPSIVHALGFYQAWVQFGLIDSYPGLIIAHALKGVPYVVIAVSASLANFDVRLEQAARSLGATVGSALWRVVLPSVRPGILSGAVFAFITSWDELVVTMFITSRRVYTLPRKIWDGIQDNISPSVAAMATVLIVLTLLLIIAHLLYLRRRARAETLGSRAQ
jgi:putative spermidine/putrescine transport system permease protein